MTSSSIRATWIRQCGVSLIELLVAMAIAALLLLGLSQIFIGSKQTYSLQEGISRSQENARFVFSTFETSLRMAGYLGCGNENGSTRKFYNHLVGTGATAGFGQRFERPIEGFDANACNASGCSTDNAQVGPGGPAQWTPALDANIAGLGTTKPVAGSDVLVLRVLSAESAPTIGAFAPGNGASFRISAVPGNSTFVQAGGIYAIANCRPRVDIFKAGTGSTGTTIFTFRADNPFACDATTSTWACTNAEGDFAQPPLGQLAGTVNAEVHRAQYLVYYVGIRDSDGMPALFVQTTPGVAGTEVADGVESMQLTYTINDSANGVADDGVRLTAADIDALVAPGCAATAFPPDCTRDANWRKVVSVHVALLMRGQETNAGATTAAAATRTFWVGLTNPGGQGGGAKMVRPDDKRYRSVYETTIAVRNRLSSF